MNMEHRCGYRRSISTPVVIRTSDGVAAPGQICDISASGALVRSHLPAPVSALVLLQFLELARIGSRSRHIVAAEIVRHTPEGFAVEWSEFSPASVRSLLQLLSGDVTRHKVVSAH